MKRHLLLAIMLFIGTLATWASNQVTDQEPAQVAQQIVKLLEDKKWMFVPREAKMPYGVTIDNLRSDNNFIQINGDNIDIRFDYDGGNLRHNMSPLQIMRLLEDVGTYYTYFDTLPPIYMARCEISSQKIKVSKNNKMVRASITYRTVETNFNEFGNRYVIDITIDTRDLSTSIICRGMHYEETYYGNIFAIE